MSRIISLIIRVPILLEMLNPLLLGLSCFLSQFINLIQILELYSILLRLNIENRGLVL